MSSITMTQPVTKACDKTNRSRLTCFTIFDMSIDLQSLASRFDYMAVGRETCPSTQREHFQGFAYCKTAQRFPWWHKRLTPHHFEFCFGSLEQNERYCSKQGQYQEFGIKPMGDGKRRDLSEVCDAIVTKRQKLSDIAIQFPTVFTQYHNGLTKLEAIITKPYEHHTVRGTWIYGVPGAGKSHYARTHFQDVYIKAQNKWFDGYTGQHTIVLEDFDSHGHYLAHLLKIWSDKWSCSGEIKGGSVALQHRDFVVTSNFTIDEIFTDPKFAEPIKRRFKLITMDTEYISPDLTPSP